MRRALTLACAAALIPARLSGAASTCVSCHESAGTVAYLEHDFSDWKASPHAKAGIACEACHGGDATKADKAASHRGMLPSSRSESRVYFTRVPATCGSCHGAERAAFAKSRHAAELKRTGKGPNCVTCHGSMANHVLAPRELERTCTLCHRKPTRAYATLLSLNTSARAIKRLEAELQRAAKAGLETKPQEGARARAKAGYRGALVDWHTFRMDSVLKASQEAAREANVAVRELEMKEDNAGGSERK